MFVVAIICMVIALVCLLLRVAITRGAVKAPGLVANRLSLTAATVGFLLLTVLTGLLASTAVVGTKEVGIVTAFNRPVGELDNGIHFIAPWESVTEMDAAIQTDNLVESANSCVNARIAHQITACVDVTIRWRIQQSSADELFQDYRDFSNVRASLVTRELATDINTTFSQYDPLAVDSNGNATSPPLNTLASSVQGQMGRQIGGQIEVLSVFIPVLHFDSQTQGRLNALQAQIAQTRIAAQAVKTAEAQAAANQALAASVNTTPNVLVSKCMDVLSEMVTKGQQVPAGFSCWPGGSTGIVIPAAK